MKVLRGLIGMVIVIAAFYFGCKSCDTGPSDPIADQFRADGAHKQLHDALMIKVPGYKHLKTNHSVKGDTVYVTTLYNSDSGQHVIDAKFLTNGEMIEGNWLK